MKQNLLAVQRRPSASSSRRPVSPRIPISTVPKPKHDEQDAVFTRMVDDCQERIFRLALRITHNHADAEDAQQETLLKVHRNLRQFEGRSRFTTWISRIAINESLMSLRKRRDSSRVPFEEATRQSELPAVADHWHSRLEDPETACSRRELRELLDSAISQLAPRLRVVFLLRGVEELSTTETARILCLSASAVKARLRRARHDLEEFLRAAQVTQKHERSLHSCSTKALTTPQGLVH